MVKCNHCQLEFSKDIMIQDNINNKEFYFCCKGCQGVFHLLSNQGLDNFYDRIQNNKLSQPIENKDSTNKFDMNSFEEQYVKSLENGFSEINLIIEGIHCSACIWLNEKVLYETNGIYEATINHTTNKAKIIWKKDEIKLSKIIEIIRSIGYNAYPYNSSLEKDIASKAKREYVIKMIIGIFATMNIMMLGIAKYAGFFSGIDDDIKTIIHTGEFILATPVLFYSGSIFFKGAYFGIKNRFVNMDLLVSTGATLIYFYSIYVMITLEGETYFDSVTMIITFILVGKYLEILGKKRAVDSLDKIKSILPSKVLVLKDNVLTEIDRDEIKIDDIIESRVGDRISIDGVVISGEANFDESSLTGESKPIFKNSDKKIISGSINLDGVIRYKATKEYKDSTINSILNLIETSLGKKPQIEELANKLSKYFSIVILLLAFLAFLVWFNYIGSDFENSFIIAISVIIIACPCALALATPLATMIGISEVTKKGILFKEAKFLETISKVDIALFDKTGTLTEGKPKVVSVETVDKNQDNYINILYSLVSSSNHPVSIGIKEYLEVNFQNLQILELQLIKNIEAKGIKANYQDNIIMGGSYRLYKDMDNLSLELKNGYTTFIFSINNEIKKIFYLEDIIKKDAKKMIDYLKNSNIKTVMITGDNQKVAQNIYSKIGIEDFQADMTPTSKSEYIEKLQKDGNIVLMVGDGVNDAIALAQSDIGIAMGNGADISVNVSDIILLNNSLNSVLFTIKMSKRTFSFIKQNLAISLIYNSITIPLALFGYVIPLIAALSMSISSLLVIGNSFRMSKKDFKELL